MHYGTDGKRIYQNVPKISLKQMYAFVLCRNINVRFLSARPLLQNVGMLRQMF